jgi:putative tricarboxylic transport membrane protein
MFNFCGHVGRPAKGTSVNSNGRFTFRIRAPQDFYGGLTLIALALFAIWAGSDLPGQHGFSFGPGTAPRIFAGLLVICGAIVTAGGLMADGPRIEGFAIRGPALICAGILFFSVAVRPLGLVATSYLTFIIAITATHEMRWRESLIAAAVMTGFCVALFIYLLQLPFDLWPWFMI